MASRQNRLSKLKATKQKFELTLRKLKVHETKLENQIFSPNVNKENLTSITNIYNSVVPAELQSESRRDDYTVHISKYSDADFIVNGIKFSEHVKILSDGSRMVSINAAARDVIFYLTFQVNEFEDNVSNTSVQFLDPDHQSELAHHVNKCIRHNNVHDMIGTVHSFAQLNHDRASVLNHFKAKCERHFQHSKVEAKGYSIQILNGDTGTSYLRVAWNIQWYRARNCLDHAFIIDVDDTASDLAEQHTPLFLQLTRQENLSARQIMEIFAKILQEWLDHQDVMM